MHQLIQHLFTESRFQISAEGAVQYTLPQRFWAEIRKSVAEREKGTRENAL